ncbi:hypothetical protein KY285_015426 [Solanum tuberosum]|nr:hypothetical protein KY285_015426 [Solanum tuberosum]
MSYSLVLSGKMRTTTYLDSEQGLGLDLQHIFLSFKIIYQVPCILGVNLTDVDLLKFIQQCAHGRATTVPLVNLGALHEQIAKLGSWSRSSSEAWHRLHWLEINLERAAKRLRSAVSKSSREYIRFAIFTVTSS